MRYFAVSICLILAAVVGTAPWILMPALHVPPVEKPGLFIVFALALLYPALAILEEKDS